MTVRPLTSLDSRLLLVGKVASGQSAPSAPEGVLKQAGFAFDGVESLADAAVQFATAPYGLIVLNEPAPGAETEDLCIGLREHYPKCPILLLTADPLGPASPQFASAVDSVLIVPFAPIELVSIVRTLLRCHSPAVSNELFQAELAAISESSIDAILRVDLDDTIVSWNVAAERLFGFAASDVLGKKFTEIDGDHEEQADGPEYLLQLQGGEPIEFQALRTRKDGEQIETWVRGAPIQLASGEAVGATLIVRDITAQKQRDQHVHFLMRELTHRSKNLLAVIQAMARQSLSHLNSPEEFVTRFSERLSGLAGSHDLLSNVDWAGASLVALIRSQLRHYEDHFDEKIHLKGPDLFLRPEAAQNIGIALHELSTNAAKYGALSVPDGSVSISWDLVSEKGSLRLKMSWEEKGGPSVNAPNRKGFGHVVMDRITGQALGGVSHADFKSDGVIWSLDVPAASVVLEREKA